MDRTARPSHLKRIIIANFQELIMDAAIRRTSDLARRNRRVARQPILVGSLAGYSETKVQVQAPLSQ
jgi:hypothetical protein